jgi:hypothetical protein
MGIGDGLDWMSRWKESYLVSSFPHLVFRRNSQICEEREKERDEWRKFGNEMD